MKNFVCIFLSFVILFSCVSVPVLANDSTKVVYFSAGKPEAEVTGLAIGDVYIPDRFPAFVPADKTFIGWRNVNGEMIDNEGIILNSENNNLYAVFADKYLINKNAVITKDKTADGKIYAPYIYNDNYYGLINFEVNGGFGPKEEVTEGIDAPYTRFVSGQYNGKSVSLLYDENGIALTGEWNKTYEISIQYRITDIESKIHIQPVFGLRKDIAKSTNADDINEEKFLRVGHTNQLTRRWDYSILGSYEYWFSNDPANASEFNIVEEGFSNWRTVTFTVETGVENADYLSVFGIYVNVGGGYKSNVVEIKNITVTGEYNVGVEYILNGETVSIADNVAKGETYTVDRSVENTETHYFAGWYLDSEFKNKADKTFVFEEKTTLYAKMVEYKKDFEAVVSDYEKDNYILQDENGEAFIVQPDSKYRVELTYSFDNSQNPNGYAEYHLSTGGNEGEKVRLEPTRTERKVVLYVTTPLLENYIDGNLLQVLRLNSFIAEECSVVLENVNVSKTSAIANSGVSMLKTENPYDTQALRFYFAYDTTDGTDIFLGNAQYNVVSRGILVAKGIDGACDIKRENADSKYVYDFNTTELYKCWTAKSYDDIKEQLYYSCYVSNIASENEGYNNTDRFYARGYIVYKKGTKLYTVYSDPSSYTVKEVAEFNKYHHEGNYALTNEKFRELVWNLEFETETDTKQLEDRLNTSIHTMVPDWDVLRFAHDEEHYFLDNGDLVLRLTKDEATNKFKTAPCLTTTDRMSFKYGYLEMRAKIDYGYYMFYSWWMQPDKKLLPENFKYYGEIDIFETWWQARGLTFSVGKWYNGYQGAAGQYPNGVDISKHEGNYKFTFPKDVNLKDEYHIYGLEWTEEYLKAYVDGYCYYTIYIDEASDYSEEYPGMECFHDYYYLCWNNWMYISHAEETELENGYADFAIDYVRLFQNKETEEIKIY